MKFGRNLLKWQEFWDSFDTTVNRNPSIEDIDKLNYSRAQLCGKAKDVIAGLEVTSAIDTVAGDLLQGKYSNKQLMIDANYSKLRDKPISSTYYTKLRIIFDQIKRHIQSLEALEQKLENNFRVSLIRSKVPNIILAEVEKYKYSNAVWNVINLRKNLKNTCQPINLEKGWVNWIETRMTLKRNKRKLATSEDNSNIDHITTINPLNHLL